MIKKTYTSLGAQIRRGRLLIGMSLSELGKKVGKDKAWLSMIECGKRQCSPELLEAINKAFQEQIDCMIEASIRDRQDKLNSASFADYGLTALSSGLANFAIGKTVAESPELREHVCKHLEVSKKS